MRQLVNTNLTKFTINLRQLVNKNHADYKLKVDSFRASTHLCRMLFDNYQDTFGRLEKAKMTEEGSKKL